MKIGDNVFFSGRTLHREEYEYLLNSFKEAFSHSSLSIERAFENADKYMHMLETSKNNLTERFYELLPTNEKKEIKETAHSIIVFYGSKYSVFDDKLTGDIKQVERLYNKYFDYFEPFIYYHIAFDKDGKFDKTETLHKLENLFINLPQLKSSYNVAYNMKMDNLNAFDYAMTLGDLSISDAIEINRIVNNSDDDVIEGYKKTNNDLFGAPFVPTDKEAVPTEMQKLFNDYKDNFGIEIEDPWDPNISYDERVERTRNIFKKEAIFHIRFERIHPFQDGNGRTGRIILNHNLIQNKLAPVLITNVMSQDYKDYINNNDVDGLTKFLVASSSQQSTNWTSLIRAGLKVNKTNINPKNEKLAEISRFEQYIKILNKK